MTTPVLITAFRRPDFLNRVLSCFHGRANPIYVWLNGPNNSNDEQSILECHRVISETSANVVFVKTNSEHFPSGQSIINAIDWIFSLESSAIILEDDIVVSEEFIDFMDFSIEYFKPLESGVGSIVGSCFVPHDSRLPSSLRKSVFTSSWGWGTWKNRWVEFDRNLSDWNTKKAYLPLLLRDLPSRSRFNSIYRSIRAGTFDAWDYRWQFTNWRQGWITIAPNTNLVMNIGFDNRSTHTFSAPSWLPTSFENYSLEPQDFSNVPYDKVGDEWYKSNVLGLNYTYFLRTKIRTALNLFKKCLSQGKPGMIRRLIRKIASVSGVQPFDSRYAIGVATLAAHRSSLTQRKNLWDYECKIYSQWGEDGILDYLFDSLSIDKPCIVEFGVGDFSECNSRFSAEHRNANLFLVDSRSDLLPKVKSNPLYWKSIIEVRNEWITPSSAEILLSEANQMLGRVDCLSLDIDGNDYWVLRDLKLDEVSVVVVEYNALFGANYPVTVPRDDEFNRNRIHHSNLYYGASLLAWIKLFENKGFVFVGSNRVGNNAFFVAKKFANLFSFDVSDLTRFTDWRVRESRSQDGDLTYVSGVNRIRIIENLPLLNTVSNELALISTIFSLEEDQS